MKKTKKVAKKAKTKPTKKTAKMAVKKAVKKTAKKTAVKKKKVTKKTITKAVKSAAKTVSKKIAAKRETAPITKETISLKDLEQKFYPLLDRVLVLKDIEQEKTAGGLFIPTTAQEKPFQGTVVAIGKGTYSKRGHLRPLDVKVGDSVLFGKYSGTEVELEGKPLLIVNETDILGIVE